MNETAAPKPRKPRDSHGIGIAGTSIIVFILGIIVGIPIANMGADVLVRYAGEVFAVLFGVFLIILLIAGAIAFFRKQIWGAIFHRAEIEMDRFARPLADVAKFAAEQDVPQATGAARDLAELVLARYAWVSTRRWLLGTITGLIAAIAALAGSALLFQQNQLLRAQNTLLTEQTSRLGEQNKLIESQIELGEAQRSTAIVPEILEIGALVGAEVERLRASGTGVPTISNLSESLRARILAATTAARPYRYLRTPLLDLDDQTIMSSGLLRRTDLPASAVLRERLQAGLGQAQFSGEQLGVMSDRPLSPERGQLITILLSSGFTDLSELGGADFSFAEVRAPQMNNLVFGFSNLRFADFDNGLMIGCTFDGTYLEHARFRNARINGTRFSTLTFPSLPGSTAAPMVRGAELSGTDFSGARLNTVVFDGSRGFGTNFDGAVLHKVDFKGTDLSGSTFRNAIFGVVDFTGASLKSVDFDGALVFSPDFLDVLGKQAAPDSFDPARFKLEPITAEQFALHPRWADAWLDGLEEKPAFRIVRVKDFS
jgi:uncharacterized protein YjbI with pentapeptide repeats